MEKAIEFFNNGQKCIFHTDLNFISLENLTISFDLIMNQLYEIKVSYDECGLFIKSKKYFIEIKYKYSQFDTDIKIKKIPLKKNEIDIAQKLVDEINCKREKELQEKKEQEEELEKKFNKKVKVIDDDNGKEYLLNSYSSQLTDNNLCLIVSNVKTYHTWLDCYERWLPSMKEDFTCWHIKEKKEVIKKGYHKCSFCSERDYDSDNFKYEFDETEI